MEGTTKEKRGNKCSERKVRVGHSDMIRVDEQRGGFPVHGGRRRALGGTTRHPGTEHSYIFGSPGLRALFGTVDVEGQPKFVPLLSGKHTFFFYI